jgi:hypothetical protein
MMNEDAATPQQVVNIQNKIDLNGTTRTVACNSTRVLGARVDNNNGILGIGALDAYFEASAGKLNVTQGPPATVIRIR